MQKLASVAVACDLAVFIQRTATLESDIADTILIAQDLPGVAHSDIARRFPTNIGAKVIALENLIKIIDVVSDQRFDCLSKANIKETFDIRNRLAHDKIVALDESRHKYFVKLLRFHAPYDDPPIQKVGRNEWEYSSAEMKRWQTTAKAQVNAMRELRKVVWSRLSGWPQHIERHVPNALCPTSIE